MSNPPGAPILIALPSGLVTSGVVAWAVRLVNAFANKGRLAGLILHTPSHGYAPLNIALHYNVRVHDLSELPPLGEANGDLSPYIPRYRDAIHDLALKAGQPVAFSPNLLGDCYGIAAAIAMVEPEIIRVLGWAHVDLPYEVTVLKHYEPAIARFVACSRVLQSRLNAAMPQRDSHIEHVPYGVVVNHPGGMAALPFEQGDRPAHDSYQGQRPLRIIYSGRIEQDAKRVGALIHLSDELARRGVAHRLTLLGDGPAAAEIDDACASRPSIVRLPPVSSERVHAILAQNDLFVMASRVEGLSISLLEAMAVGCVPVITRTSSGATEAITDGVDGLIVDWELPSTPRGALRGTGGPPVAVPEHARLGQLLAEGVCSVVARGLPRFAQAARAAVGERFTHDLHVARAMKLVDEVTAEEPRTWPASRACAFTASAAFASRASEFGLLPAHEFHMSVGSGTVPADAAARLEAALAGLRGRRVLIHGTGRHTIELGTILARFTAADVGGPAEGERGSTSGATIVGFTDDDPARHGTTVLGLPVFSPHAARTLDASDVVISSFINQDSIWQRRGVYESHGMTVHRLYPDAA